ncbi:MAG: hypothetical protein R3328_07575 [Planococcaceae bacterium]|nr:hypothetical protein [Planococcaceae bacterium]
MQKKIALPLIAALALAGCNSLTPTTETKKSYVIYNVKTNNDVTPSQMANAIKTALQSNTSSVKIVEDLPPHPLPEQAPRFQLVSPFGKNSGLAALAGNMTIPTCNGALVYAQAADNYMSNHGENTQFYTCLWQYKDGYHVDIYTQFDIKSGGIENLGKELVRGVMGDSSQFIPRTINNIKTNLDALNVTTKLVTAYPDSLAQELTLIQ